MSENLPDNTTNPTESYIPRACTFTAAAMATAAYVTGTGGAACSMIGFVPQIAANSIAANLMSFSATTGYGGGLVSFMQSSGALFVNAYGTSFLTAASAIVIPIAVGYASYKAYYWFYGGNGDKFEDYSKCLKDNFNYYILPYAKQGEEYCTNIYNWLCEIGSKENIAACGEYLKENIDYYVTPYVKQGEEYVTYAYDWLCGKGSKENIAVCGEYLKENIDYYIQSYFRNSEKC